jgi:hypothetical protein
MVFRAGLRDPCMHEGCRETFGKRENTRAAGECTLRFPKVEQHPKPWITLSCTENHLVIVL